MKNNLLLLFAISAGLLIWNIPNFLNKNSTSDEKIAETVALTGQQQWELEYEKKKKKHNTPGYKKADKPNEYYLMMNSLKTRAGEDEPAYGANYRINELSKAKNHLASSRVSSASSYEFDERGPGNVPGRTRCIVVDPDDADVWVVGAEGGGIWKTIDGGATWTNTSPDLPTLSIGCITMAKSDKNIIYVGTGNSWGGAGGIGGNGIFKSTNLGDTWTQIPATADNEDFQIVTRIVIDPADPNIILSTNHSNTLRASFTAGIFKSKDGGEIWSKVYSANARPQQIVADPNDFNILYATVNSREIVKSTDAGENWVTKSSGFASNGRIELAISPIDTDVLYASTEGNIAGTGSDLFISTDAGENWNPLTDDSNGDVDFLGGQGWFDHVLLAHPFDKDIVYAGGVNLFQFSMESGSETGDPGFIGASENNTSSFLDLVNFNSGSVYGDKIALGEDLEASEFVSIEILFGPGKSQKAHRYTVDKQGSGVPDADFTYEDYVDVPFEVWDTDNNEQLMVAFRDQQEDGKFNLIENNTDDNDGENNSREYLYISLATYDDTNPNSSMATDGGHIFENMYFFWPFLTEGGTWDENNLPESSFSITWGALDKKFMSTENISDAYGAFSGKNQFEQTIGSTNQIGLHPDHHNLIYYVTDVDNEEFQLILTNDGGIYKSNVGTNPGFEDGDWTNSGLGCNTTQFYGADKRPGESRYVAGAQDNGTWLTQDGDEGAADAQYVRGQFGDGFGVAWHGKNPELMLTSVYGNIIYKSINEGTSFIESTTGITDRDNDDSPFITKIENVDSDPDVVFTVGGSGVFKSDNFGSNWTLTPITENWGYSNFLIDVKISRANNNIVWAGNSVDDGNSIQVSKDGGDSFSATTNYTEVELGQISGLATHPTEETIAYVLFSQAKGPKILKTENLGDTWEDISGYGTNTISDNGFPDVAVFDLFVMPHETSTLWAGTEIGIFESTDDGSTWHILNGDLPAASIWEFRHVDDQIVIATHGRGIWSITIPELPEQAFNPEILFVSNTVAGEAIVNVSLTSNSDSLQLFINSENVYNDKTEREIGTYEIVTETVLSTSSDIVAKSYIEGIPYVSRISTSSPITFNEASNSYKNDFETSSSDFIGIGFKINSSTGFGSKSIFTSDGYEDNVNYTYTLKTPIIVSSDQEVNKIEFSEVVLVEPENDYVVVEGSIDGVTWLPLLDSYDASKEDTWKTLFENSTKPEASDMKERSITLTDTFDAGDEILIRFKLNSNESINGWGWSIDDLKIQSVVLSTPKALELASSVFPNPVMNGNMMSIQFEKSNAGNVNWSLRNISGQIVYSNAVAIPSGTNRIDLQIPDYLTSGVYFMDVRSLNSNSSKTHKIIINNNH